MPDLVNSVKSIISSTAAIVKGESSAGINRLLNSTPRDDNNERIGILDRGTGIESTSAEDAVAKTANYSIMDQTQPAMIKQADYVIDVILPMALIALLFVGNAIIVYIIFQYRKRLDPNFRKTPGQEQGEEISLSVTTNGQEPQV